MIDATQQQLLDATQQQLACNTLRTAASRRCQQCRDCVHCVCCIVVIHACASEHMYTYIGLTDSTRGVVCSGTQRLVFQHTAVSTSWLPFLAVGRPLECNFLPPRSSCPSPSFAAAPDTPVTHSSVFVLTVVMPAFRQEQSFVGDRQVIHTFPTVSCRSDGSPIQHLTGRVRWQRWIRRQ